MNRLEKLKSRVKELYEKKDPNRDDWADWLYENHVIVVARYAKELASRYSIDPDLSEAAALLHDIADAVMSRTDPAYETRSAQIAQELLAETGYNDEEVELIINDALKFHSCRDGEKPHTEVGKVLATADALAHLETSYYSWAVDMITKRQNAKEAKEWASSKLRRDYNDKVCFEDVKKEAEPYYKKLTGAYS